MFKKRKRGLKRGLKRRRQITVFFFLLIVLMIAMGPFLWHIQRLRQAENDYEMSEVEHQLQWFKTYGGVLNRLKLLDDANLWLKLNLGQQDLAHDLVSPRDDQQRFWLFLINLRDGNRTEASKQLASLDTTPYGSLGQGLMALTKGDLEEARQRLAQDEATWKSLPRQAQALRSLILTQVAMNMGDAQSTQKELETARQLDPKNPAYLSMAFTVAIWQGEWSNAIELSQTIDKQTWRSPDPLYETQKTILAIHENNETMLSASRAVLKTFPQAEALQSYVSGIDALYHGQIQEGKRDLERAVKGGLEGKIKSDAQAAIAQITERQNADSKLQPVMNGNGE